MCEKCFSLESEVLKVVVCTGWNCWTRPAWNKGTGSILVVVSHLSMCIGPIGTKGILPENMWTIPLGIHRMFGSGQDTICRWLSSLLSTTQWVCCPFCEPANDIPWKRSQFWGGWSLLVYSREKLGWYVVHGRKELSRHSFFGPILHFSQILHTGSGCVPAERFASSPKHSSRVSPSHGSHADRWEPRWGSCLLTRPCRPSVRRIEDGSKFGDSEIHDGSWADICRLHKSRASGNPTKKRLKCDSYSCARPQSFRKTEEVWCFLSWRDSLLWDCVTWIGQTVGTTLPDFPHDFARILLEEVGDVGRAVEFASETQDVETPRVGEWSVALKYGEIYSWKREAKVSGWNLVQDLLPNCG